MFNTEKTISDFVIQNNILVAYRGIERNVVLPHGIVKIGENVFVYSNIKSIVIPDGVIAIEDSAFRFCPDLKSVELSTSVQSKNTQNSNSSRSGGTDRVDAAKSIDYRR